MKQHLMKINLFLLIMIVLLAFGGCAQKSPDAVEPGSLAGTYLSDFVTLGARVAGTDAEVEAADWIESTLKEMGYAVTREPFTYTDETGVQFDSQNLIAIKEGATSTQVVVGGHYDSKDVGVGADDNGSAVAVMLETASVLQSVETPQTIKFVFFGAEEVDRKGSFYHVANMSATELKDTILMVNFDSLIAGDISYVYGDAGENGKFRDRVLELAMTDNLDLITQPGDNADYPAGTTGDWSDHAAFMEKGVPYIYFESTNWTLGVKDGYTQVDPKYGVDGEIWHTEFDNLEYLEENFPGRTALRLSTFSQVIQEFLAEDLSKL
jgi:hypothetical protein